MSDEGLSPAKRWTLRQRLIKKKGVASGAAIPRRPRDRGALPLSLGQERLWFVAELEPESGVYNTSSDNVRATGPPHHPGAL